MNEILLFENCILLYSGNTIINGGKLKKLKKKYSLIMLGVKIPIIVS